MGRQKKNKPKKDRLARGRKSALAKSAGPELRKVDIAQVNAIVERTAGTLSPDDHGTLRAAIGTLAFLTAEIEAANASIKRLRQVLFGSSTEKTSAVLGEPDGGEDDKANVEAANETPAEDRSLPSTGADPAAAADQVKSKPKGHGRNSSAALTGADKVCVPHETLEAGALCPGCGKGKVYPMAKPKILVRITGMAPLGATVTELERLRCNLCGEVFSAREPPEVGSKKYDESVASMIGLFKYGAGVPFHRLEKLQAALGIPISCSTQWDLVDEAAALMVPAYQELVRQAAQGDVLHNDDTTMKILELSGKRRAKAIADGSLDPSERKGIFTSGIVSAGASAGSAPQIVLFFTGTQHAGENLADVLAKRVPDLAAPIQMCDGLSHNTAPEFKSIVAHCLAHARRRFVEVVEGFPTECAVVLKAVRAVYQIDAESKQEGLAHGERLALHVKHSRPHMVRLKRWLRLQISQKKTEPNSGLGQAIGYTLKHWDALTLFLREPGAPLDNNVCERALKRVILHRKNAYFYKTENGARVGDLYMSLIYTAELCGASPLEYLNALQVNHEELARDPAAWMPWNYADAVARTGGRGPGPG